MMIGLWIVLGLLLWTLAGIPVALLAARAIRLADEVEGTASVTSQL